MGAWIEIIIPCHTHPSFLVAPYMGAWIEMPLVASAISIVFVAPYMGAWIEIYRDIHMSNEVEGRSLHGSVD